LISLIKNKKAFNGTNVELLLLAISVSGTFFILGLVLWYCQYGIDLTDESFYIVWISNPFIYSVSASQFGYVYHQLYEWVNGDIAALRQINILITYGLALLLTDTFFRKVIFQHSVPLSWTRRIILSASFASASLSSLVFQGLWLPTPSYNSLAFQALLIAETGVLLSEKKVSPTVLFGWTLIGFGGWLAFMAKPTTAAALGVGVIIQLIAAGKFSFRHFLIPISVAIGLLILSALYLDGSLSGFLNRLQSAVADGNILSSSHSILVLLKKLLSFPVAPGKAVIIFIGSATSIIVAYYSGRVIKSKYFAIIASIPAISIVIIVLLKATKVDKLILEGGSMLQLFLLLIIPFLLFSFAAMNRGQLLSQLSISEKVLAICFFFMPHVYAFGTNNDYWLAGSSAGLFWFLSGLYLLRSSGLQDKKLFMTLFPFGLATQLLTAAIVLIGLAKPYRQPQPLWMNSHIVSFGRSTSPLILSDDYGISIERAVNAANQAGFEKGTPVIDLTGKSPGMLYFLGAINIGQPWMIGGYPGSDHYAVQSLKKVPTRELVASWVLFEPDSPRHLAPRILESIGADFIRDYEVMASWSIPDDGKKLRIQYLLMPRRTIATAMKACETKRAINNSN